MAEAEMTTGAISTTNILPNLRISDMHFKIVSKKRRKKSKKSKKSK